ncbi:MAG: hypothetical protein IJX98_01565 [Clostridia bacterium]|nr:hypothetical protein [Clostridia bacterium]
MKITDIDKNFIQQTAKDELVWVDVKTFPFKLYGVSYDEAEQAFVRMPVAVAKQTNEGIEFLNTNTAGGRLAFATDSDTVSFKCVFPNLIGVMSHMTIAASNGFSLYVNGKFWGMLSPDWSQFVNEKEIEFSKTFDLTQVVGVKEIKLYFPLYGGVKELFVAVEAGSEVLPSKEYKHKKPIVYYGSSITQGGCASRPGNDYEAYIERWLDADFINLGFSGSAKGEKVVAEYIATIDSSIVVMDYDYNAPDVAHLQKTHYPFYKVIREALPDTPIVFMTNFNKRKPESAERREVIRKNYVKTIEAGDGNTVFINGEQLLGVQDEDACTVDGTHPNDLGFYRIAQAIYPIIKNLLK